MKPIPDRFAEASRLLEITVEQVQEKPEPESDSLWTPLELDRAVSAGGATLTRQKDGSILATGENSSPDTYTITASTSLLGITAVRLEVLPDREFTRPWSRPRSQRQLRPDRVSCHGGAAGAIRPRPPPWR